ncbi:MAG TPA: hypothetical protein VHO24_09925 [Opitutaceae bacterium]|nr:hypothetical protein [Opitutaceae bacterium]
MKIPRRLNFLLLTLFLATGPLSAKEESVLLYENRRVSIAVPEGFEFRRVADKRGPAVVITDAQHSVVLNITLLPDLDGNFTSARTRKEFVVENFHEFLESSVEQAMQFEEMNPRSGACSYCVFTDAHLVGRKEMPPNEYLYATIGVKADSGCLAVFTLLSNDTASKEYQAAMKILRESVQVKKASPAL